MTITTEKFVSVSEQRAIEKAAKEAAVAKKKAALQQAMKNGLTGETELFSALVDAEWIGLAGQKIAAQVPASLLSGKNAAALSSDVKTKLLPFLTIASEEDSTVFPIANRAAQLVFEALLDIAFLIDGEKVPGIQAVENQQIQELYRAVGEAIALELNLTRLAETHPSSYYSLLSVLRNPAYSQEAKAVAKQIALRGLDVFSVLSTWMADHASFEMPAADPSVTVLQWTNEEKGRVAAALLDAVTSVVPADKQFWAVQSVTIDKETRDFVTLADGMDSDAVLDEISKRAHSYGPVDQVNSWQEYEYGGYLSNAETHEQSFIRGRSHESTASEQVLKTVDAAQSVRYVVNDFILKAAQALSTEKIVVGKFVSPKGHHYSKSMRTKRALAAAAEWSGRSFVSPWNVDYRGRMYPISSVLTIQSTDFEKALLKFAIERPVTDDTAVWLSVHLANTFGHDKWTLEARVAWVYEEETQKYISAIATDPTFYLKAWASGELAMPSEPWQFLAACEEFYALYLADDCRTTTNLPVAVDASCSGIQVLAGLMKDEAAAFLVNVVPSDERQDAYEAVASIVREALQQPYVVKKGKEKISFDLSSYAPLITRSVVKKVVMTLAYNASAQSHGEYIVESLRGSIDEVAEADRGALYSAVGVLARAAMKKLLPGVIAMKQWLADAAFAAAPQQGVLRFETPSGMMLGQKKNVVQTLRIQSALSGVKKDLLLAVATTDEVAPGSHRTCTMPNIVHAIDASLLHGAFADFEQPFALIHDSVLTTATDMQAAVDAYKASYVQHFADGSLYQQLLDTFQVGGAPAQGDLDVSVVMDSDFFLA